MIYLYRVPRHGSERKTCQRGSTPLASDTSACKHDTVAEVDQREARGHVIQGHRYTNAQQAIDVDLDLHL